MKSSLTLDIDNARATEDPHYVPAHKKNGRDISAKCYFNAVVNKPAIYRDGQKVKDPVAVFLRVGGWGNMADTLAKAIKSGKVFSCKCAVDTYEQVQKRKNAAGDWIPATHDDGTVVTNTAYGYTIIPGSLNLGEDSAKTISDEIVANKRPVGWNDHIPLDLVKANLDSGTLEELVVEAEGGREAWKRICDEINKAEYKGGPKFGNAQVHRPTGDNIELLYPIEKGAAPPPPKGEMKVDGFTYQEYRDAGWSDEDLLADERKKVLVAHKVGPIAAPPKVEESASEEEVVETEDLDEADAGV